MGCKIFLLYKSFIFIENQHLGNLNKFIHNAWHPHLGSFFWAFFWNLMPIKLEYFGRLFYVFLFCFSIFYICHNNFKDNSVSSYFEIPTDPAVVLSEWSLPPNLRKNVYLDYERASHIIEVLNSKPEENYVIIGVLSKNPYIQYLMNHRSLVI